MQTFCRTIYLLTYRNNKMSKDTELKFSAHELRRAAAFLSYSNKVDLKTLRKNFYDNISDEITQIYIKSADNLHNSKTTEQ